MKALKIIATAGIGLAGLACYAPPGDARTAFVLLAWVCLAIPFSVAVGTVIKRIGQSKSELM